VTASTEFPLGRPDTTGCKLWAIGGGKGGIGKSVIATNAATVVARSGLRVILVDFDLGGANVHTYLGVRAAQRVNLSDVLQSRVTELKEALVETPVPGLKLILGAMNHPVAAQATRTQRERLLKELRELGADIVILDLAAGMDRTTVDLFVGVDESLLVTTPEPTAIENVYAFIRASFYRRLAPLLTDSPASKLLRETLSARSDRGVRSASDLLSEIRKLDPEEGDRVEMAMAAFQPRLVLNQVRTPEDVRLGFAIASMSRRHLGVHLDYLGYINYDDHVWRSVKERRTLVLAYPQSDGALYIRQIVRKLLRS
jgi:flagellar biosynthesis protein FlhG